MPETAPTLEELTQRLLAFRDARDWRRFHSLKDLIVSLNLEAAEALELTQWKGEETIEAAAAKIEKNETKYPVEKSRGNARKYTELRAARGPMNRQRGGIEVIPVT